MSETLWTTVGLRGVDFGPRTEAVLGPDLSLLKANESLRCAGDLLVMSKVQHDAMRRCPWFLVQRTVAAAGRSNDANKCTESLQDALMALQIVKPIETDGFIFQGDEWSADKIDWHGTHIRWPMSGGQWARLRLFDALLLTKAESILERVQAVMAGTVIAMKNAVHLLQLALEHPHPYVACLLAVTGLEAVFDSNDRWDFETKLCDLLGPSTLAFPDWNSPDFPPLPYTVKDLAVHLYTLRSKVAHGADLRDAIHDKNSPVDLLQLREYIPSTEPVRYAMLLGESSIYLLGRVLQRVI